MCVDPTAGLVLNSRLGGLIVPGGAGVLWFEWDSPGCIGQLGIELVPPPSVVIVGDLLEALHSESCPLSRGSITKRREFTQPPVSTCSRRLCIDFSQITCHESQYSSTEAVHSHQLPRLCCPKPCFPLASQGWNILPLVVLIMIRTQCILVSQVQLGCNEAFSSLAVTIASVCRE
ncbi:hypothetical protein CPSG_03130 [Coccidioides posadasii str. Silveira]|uniref:Uncharacterized protein n=1 Tax=Coccidioides posadasii (strain RMSCC 757 / Silveira) TaxID=443226 RepID=E9D0V1_COCPS|nr:hypothetical protein CPSG_03130 [Coccidioides posadasii str. Silveira]